MLTYLGSNISSAEMGILSGIADNYLDYDIVLSEIELESNY